ncbi:MAG: helix-turn-helix transcriptional regulator [Rhodobacterales bacterium]|nr:helix-turn-helix transcriptional regulator [Rhodobacterales bacterium]
MTELMNTREVAEYLRIKERKVYDLVGSRSIPCTRVTGKWLFPKSQIDRWIAKATTVPAGTGPEYEPAPPVIAGSQDPLLDWAVRESGCNLAMMTGGSLDGLRRMADNTAMMAGMHVLDADSGDYNVPLVRESGPARGVVLVEWARRRQGLVLAPGNPLNIQSMADLRERKARLALRQAEAGSQLLLVHLLSEAGVRLADLTCLDHPARSETDLGLAVLEDKADAGVAVSAVAQRFRLDFLPLHEERFDLLVRRRDYFEPPVQALLAFAQTAEFRDRAAEMGGYDITGLGRVVYNAP